jgi:sigma-E factor negative regulatory protein RseB
VIKSIVTPITIALLAIVFEIPVPVHANPAVDAVVAQRSVSEWLQRMHNASSRRAYMGTFVVSSAAGNLSTSRIWHVCDGEQQMERVDALTGIARTTLRHNDDVLTFLPNAKLARREKRDSFGMFPNLFSAGDSSIAEFYTARNGATDRAAGYEADVVTLVPKDKLRFGYRVWSEKKSGLVIKLQTLDTDGRVIEQSAFSELQLDAPVKMEKLAQMMANTEGYRVEKASEAVKTTATHEGWVLKTAVPGFKPVSCFKRDMASATAHESTVQWIFSDGLATVSLFLEIYDPQRHVQTSLRALGATQSLTRHMTAVDGDWWLTVLGEVPTQTLQAFAQSLERKK